MVAGYAFYFCFLLDTLRPTQTLHSKEIQNRNCVLTVLHREADISAYSNLYAASLLPDILASYYR
jgi:hypothetical protein